MEKAALPPMLSMTMPQMPVLSMATLPNVVSMMILPQLAARMVTAMAGPAAQQRPAADPADAVGLRDAVAGLQLQLPPRQRAVLLPAQPSGLWQQRRMVRGR